MTALSVRRFPYIITRRRQEPGAFSEFGEFVQGQVVETEMRANVQPLKLADSNFVGGVSLVERLRVYVRESDSLQAAFEDRQADKVIWRGATFVVEESRAWPGRHTRAVALRET